MSDVEKGDPTTGLRDVFDVLVKAPSERLLSLTIQLGESPEENIIHALCLIVLQKETQALSKLQMLKDNTLARHLADNWQGSEGKLEDFAVQCSHFQASTLESLAALARIFKVLSEQKLCDPLLRNMAYKRAVKTGSTDDLDCSHFREEAKAVCGPQFAEWMCSYGSYSELHRSLNEGTALRATESQVHTVITSLPSPLQANMSVPSYPSHLEISFPPTASYQGDKKASDNSKLNTPAVPFRPEESLLCEPQPKSTGSPLLEPMKDSHMTHNQTPSLTNPPSTKPKPSLPSTANISLPTKPVPKESHKSAEEEEEEIFYAFVILHAPEDEEVAEHIKEKLESATSSVGATFSENFAIPGKSTISCVEDAINNSAFTFLLLTRNFNTRMLEMKTNVALINSIHKTHKFNTVIPLLPRENCMPKQSIPIVLQTIVPLHENKSFERKIQKSLSPAKIEIQRKIWTEETERLKRLKLQQDRASLLMEEKLVLGSSAPPEQDGGDDRLRWQPPTNIHIEHAKYIMIGNDSQMTVDLGGSADREEDQ
ncbi:TIR domain-containing adapter molecule 1 [Parambassis ranga]|uniref:TIR domain-containing adapter molecule 1 n=1 Tax=Parambassis ranga TaxID=210632 RepID=A0A6P7K4B4_9TELE|nr:TIR domain-containing adapter molecule 1-like [Parambassis ranga]